MQVLEALHLMVPSSQHREDFAVKAGMVQMTMAMRANSIQAGKVNCGLLRTNADDIIGTTYGPQSAGLTKSHFANIRTKENSEKRQSGAYESERSLKPFYESSSITLYLGDARHVLSLFPENSIDCIVTSPPYYGQRDYGVDGQLGLEAHPQVYIDKLVATFREARRVLKPSGSLWVNIGDTYWSGKGRPHGPDHKQKHRRFERPQDKTGPRPWCAPKQLLLIPHRFAIAMQDDGWIVRNDNVWHKPSPTPDPVTDRCALTHEYVFHFVKQRRYYYSLEAVAVPSSGKRTTKPPPSVWTIATIPSQKKHAAVFPDRLVMLPILATLPRKGVLLDPFCGSGTALQAAVALGEKRRAIGIDVSQQALHEAREILSPRAQFEDIDGTSVVL